MKRHFFFLFLFFPLFLFADKVIDLRTGREWQGKILEGESDEKWVVLELPSGGKLRFLRKEVKVFRLKTSLPPLSFRPTSKEGKKEKNWNFSSAGEEEIPSFPKIPEAEKGVNLSPPVLSFPSISFFSFFMQRPWYEKLFVGMGILLLIFAVSWHLLFASSPKGKRT